MTMLREIGQPSVRSYRGIADEIAGRVSHGELAPGQRLPSVREAAALWGVNLNTVQRAYAHLAARGIVESNAGGGTRVSGAGVQQVAASRQLHLRLLLGEAIGTALGLGYEASELEAAFIGQLAVWREARAGRVRSEAGRPSARQRLVRIGGSHDLGLELLGAQLRAAPRPVRLHMDLSSSLGGLFALANGDCDLAGCHLRDEASGELNVPFVRSVLPGRSVDLVTLAEREQGLMLAATNPLGIAGVADLARAEIRFVNRQRGAGTRLLLDHQLRLSGVRSDQVNGYLREEPSHIAVASAVATGAVDVGLGIRAAAEALGLGFIPLARERYELALLSAAAERPAIRRVLETLRSRDFKAALRALAGYATHDTGQTRTVS